jgi:DNA-binding XRE family transcriptional regulator
MPTQRLDNYLRTYRKHSGLSQDEIAYILGARDGTQISRHEHFCRIPNLETALAYEAIYGIPVRELFAGVYERVERAAARRAWHLSKRIGAERVSGLRVFGKVAPDAETKLAA